MSTVELYTKDTRVWIPDADKVWRAAKLLENYILNSSTLKIITEDDENELSYDIGSTQVPNPKLPPLRNPDILIGQNDLTALSYLNEPEVLYNLEVRFLNNNQIYTYCGIVLVAINPYEQLPIYGNEIIQAYNGCDVQNMDPHIFAVSEEAFQKMVHFEQNQSIIVSGESGAGKTVSAKYTMRYFANVGGSSEETQVEKKVLASNPIMEAFGNAKTTRNDNSSRFGKFIQIDFNRSHHIVGGSMKTYLLEKSRVVFQAAHERNYHIFYQLCAQCKKKEYEYLRLSGSKDFVYTSQGQADEIENVNDSDVFRETLEAFKLLDISKAEQSMIFSLISAILHLGNLKIINERTNESCSIAKNDESLKAMCELLKIEEANMRAWLCYKRIKTVSEIVNTPLALSQALFSRDALAKHMYSQLFNWIVDKINDCLKSPVKTHSFIGVLDIYGFETFAKNSFEQFCINYANEKLQQQFCQHVFKLEQEEYIREQIKWSFIEFYDNQPCIELIEGKLGMLDLLDEECKMPKGSDLTWCSKLYEKHLKPAGAAPASATNGTTTTITPQNHFSKPRMSSTSFLIHHFAERVEYQVDGFLEKNRDTVLEEQLRVLKASEHDFVADLFAEDTDDAQPRGYVVKRNTMPAPSRTQAQRKKTVGSQFRDSLSSLMQALNSTTPHYVRCIKPNDQKAPFNFDARRAVEQLRACGVLETVRISAAGYPSRWTYQEFFLRYRMLVNSSLIDRQAFRKTCEAILITLIQDQTKYQFGKTKIFFQAGQVAYLEKLRSEKLRACGVMIQKHIRGWLARSKFIKMKRCALRVQCLARGQLARRLLKLKRETRAAVQIQAFWRGHRARRLFRATRQRVIRLQALCRGYAARRNRHLAVLGLKATRIQACVRGWLARCRYRKFMRGLVLLQAHFRRRKARKLFKELKIEARSVEHQRQLNKGLENKIISLQQQIERINRERETLLAKVAELEPLKAQVAGLKQNMHLIKESTNKIHELNEQLETLRENYEKIKAEKVSLSKSKDQAEKTLKETVQTTSAELSSLRRTLNESELKTKELQAKMDEMRNQLVELENERANHQKLIKENGKLEQRFEKVRNELVRLSKPAQSMTSSGGGHNQPSLDLESLIEQLVNDTRTTLVAESTSDENSKGIRPRGTAGDNKQRLNGNGVELDVTLISKLQNRIAALEFERKHSSKYLGSALAVAAESDNNNNNSDLLCDLPAAAAVVNMAEAERLQQDRDLEMIKSQELEFENQKMREDLSRLRDLISDNQVGKMDSIINKEMMAQYDALNEEVQRRREECIQLKSLLIAEYRAGNRMNSGEQQQQHSTASDDLSSINTDGNEYEVGFNTQKILNRMLENQMTDLQRRCDLDKEALCRDIRKLREENERQHDLLMRNLTPESLAEAAFKNEFIKLADQNLELSDKCDRYSDEVKRYKKMLKIYIKRSKTTNLNERMAQLNSSSTTSMNGVGFLHKPRQAMNSTAYLDSDKTLSSFMMNHSMGNNNNNNNNNLNVTINGGGHNKSLMENNGSQLVNSTMYVPHIRLKNSGDYLGYLEWKAEDEQLLITKLIDDLKPRLAISFLPGLPAYILFMCIRYADIINDDDRVRSLLTLTVQSVKRLIKKKIEDLEYVVLWVANSCRLIHNLKQYSGEEAFQFQNNAKQNEHCLRNFDLTEYRGVLSDIAIWLFQCIIKDFEKRLSPIIVKAMLEHVSLPGIAEAGGGGKPSGTRSSGFNTSTVDLKGSEAYTIDSLIKKLGEFLNILNSHGVDPEIVNQIFKQLFYYIGATTFNNLILRKEMCNWSKGIELRFNISLLEQFVRDSRLQDSGACETLDPIIQTCQLLQSRKTDADLNAICEMCSKLTIAQIQRILFLYTPLDSYEEKLTRQFIDKVTNNLKQLRATENNAEQQVLIIDTKKQFSVCIPFNPSSIGLESIEIPEQLDLGFLKKI